ncbi:MAG: class 1 fructose-bisphosphatase [Ancrocorticia sp.]
MAPRTLTQYLLDVGQRPDGHNHAHIVSAVAVAVKLLAATISRGPLILSGIDDGGADPCAINRHLRRLAPAIILEQTSGLPQLVAVSLEGGLESLEGVPSWSRNYPRFSQVSAGLRARYLLAVEALHGTTRLAENQSVGLCFSILERDEAALGSQVQEAEFLQAGVHQLCAGMALFGPSTVLVLTTGAGVDAFTLDREAGNFLLTHPQLRVPTTTNVVAINPSESPQWPPPIKRYVEECSAGVGGPRGEDFVLRWNDSAVMGTFRVLMNGGVFIVPRLTRSRCCGIPLLHTCAPLAMIVEQAGGAAIDSANRMLERVPEAVDQRAPIIFGAREEVARIRRYFAEHEKGYDVEPRYPLFHSRTLFAQP